MACVMPPIIGGGFSQKRYAPECTLILSLTLTLTLTLTPNLSLTLTLTLFLTLKLHVTLTRGQSNLTKSASRGAHYPVRGHPRGSKVVPLNSWGRVSY